MFEVTFGIILWKPIVGARPPGTMPILNTKPHKKKWLKSLWVIQWKPIVRNRLRGTMLIFTTKPHKKQRLKSVWGSFFGSQLSGPGLYGPCPCCVQSRTKKCLQIACFLQLVFKSLGRLGLKIALFPHWNGIFGRPGRSNADAARCRSALCGFCAASAWLLRGEFFWDRPSAKNC